MQLYFVIIIFNHRYLCGFEVAVGVYVLKSTACVAELVLPDGYTIRCIHCANFRQSVGIALFISTFVVRFIKKTEEEEQRKLVINVQLQIFVISVQKTMIMSFD